MLDVALVEAELLSDLGVGDIEAHQVKSSHPNLERLMVSGKHGAGEIVEAFLACFAFCIGNAAERFGGRRSLDG